MINISGSEDIIDPEYRYKMPKIITKTEGRGNGIKTLIVNCYELAESLQRAPEELCKFFGCDLGTQSKYNSKERRAIINGEFNSSFLQERLKTYIDKFILCPICMLPETKYKIKRSGVYHRCRACGARKLIDMNHKLLSFIIRNQKVRMPSGKII